MRNAARLLPQKPLHKRSEEMLLSIHQLRYVTAWDMTRLFYTSTSINHVREILSGLSGKKDYADRNYLYRFPLPNTRIGNTEKIYTLGSRGRSYLQTQGMSVDWYFRPYKVAGMTYQNCLHVLSLTRFLIAAQVFVKNNPAWELSVLKTEYELKKEISQEYAKQTAVTITVKTSEGTTTEDVMVIPDAWLLFHRTDAKKPAWLPVFLEIDRATEQQRFFKRQIRARVLFLTSGGYKTLFGTNKGVVAYATTGNETRRDTMRKWTKEVLAELGMKNLASRFRFCSLSPSWESDGQSVFLSPIWYRAVDKNPVALLG
jgi:hypothetical protein